VDWIFRVVGSGACRWVCLCFGKLITADIMYVGAFCIDKRLHVWRCMLSIASHKSFNAFDTAYMLFVPIQAELRNVANSGGI